MTYEESAALMTNLVFRGRVKVAVLRFADAVMIEPTSVAGHNTRLNWAQQALRQPDTAAQQAQPPAVMDGAVQAAGADVTDDALQGAVEAVVQKML